MMPRIWSLTNDFSIPQLKYTSPSKQVQPEKVIPEARQKKYEIGGVGQAKNIP